jgi:3-hydroxyacyl-[acyl-carrier-protein] dehydratase
MILEYFQLVDRVIEIDRDAKRICCAANVPEKSTIFEGHFPGHPLMPGTLLVESMAQTSGYLLLSLQDFERLPFLIQVEKAKIRTFVEPGTELTVEAELVHEGSGFAVTRASVQSTEEGKAIADADLRFRTMQFPTDELRATVRNHAAAVGVS